VTPLARGQVWARPAGTKSWAVVIVESDAALDALPGTAVCMMIDETQGAPDTVVTIPSSSRPAGALDAVPSRTNPAPADDARHDRKYSSVEPTWVSLLKAPCPRRGGRIQGGHA